MINNWKESTRIVWLVAWRELRDQMRDWRIIIPMIILTLVLPILANAGARAAVNFTAQYGTPLIAERLVPFLLLVVGYFPITVSLVIALEAFVGEKERGTIEPLLVSPLKDWQIYGGKLLAGTAAPLMTSFLGIGVYLIGLAIQEIPIPDANRLAQTLILTTVQGFLMVSAAILISTQSTSVRAANLMASFIVIPMAILIQGEAIMLFWGNNQVLWLAVAGVSILTILLSRVGIVHFQREALLGREIDVLDLRWVGRVFWRFFKGEARSVGEWYGRELKRTLVRLLPAIILTSIIGGISIIFGYQWIQVNRELLPGNVLEELRSALPAGLELPTLTTASFLSIFSHNLRAVVILTLFGLFSFSTLGSLILFLNTSLIGVVLSLLADVGYLPWKVAIFGILPHGIFEVSALVLVSAVVLHGAVLLVTPNYLRSIGEVIIEGIADWCKVFIGLVIPLLGTAAVVETWITPLLISKYF